MATTRTVDLLPPIFQTQTNRQFLNATLDQLTQEPEFQKTQGYIGRRIGPGVTVDQNYVSEPTAQRRNYQLEPGVLRVDSDDNTKILDAITYPGILDTVKTQGGFNNRADRLFTSEYYAFDPFVDYDKFVNYGQYYWVPEGPLPVDVSATDIPYTDDFDVGRTATGLSFSGTAGTNPILYLARGGTYTFAVNQPGFNFWIQATPGVSGQLPFYPNISSRSVLGVVNNGEDQGTVTFNVPDKTAQQFFYDLPSIGSVDLITSLQFSQIQGQDPVTFVANYGGIDSITNLNGRTLIFITDSVEDPNRSIWRIVYVTDGLGNTTMNLEFVQAVANFEKFSIAFGSVYSNTNWYKNAVSQWEQIPLLTAVQDILYYQDSSNPNLFGIIKLIEVAGDPTLNITDILGQSNYTSPNGVIFTNNLQVTFRGPTNPASYSNNTYFVAGVGSGIELLPVAEFITPEPYTNSASVPYDSTPYDSDPYDAALNQPLVPDYLVMALNSPDRNAWSRTNRWFHIDVLTAAANYNNSELVLDNQYRAKRPILEYRGGLRLYNMGTQAKQPIDIIDFAVTDALSTINGTIGYSLDGYNFVQGTRVIFAADLDPEVRNKIFVVSFISPDGAGDGSTIAQPIINLVPASDSTVLADQCVVCISGTTLQGVSFWFDGLTWTRAQLKTKVNQAPLFDVFDADGVSYGNRAVYTSSNFVGNRLFSYAVGQGPRDPVLDFAVKYLSIRNVGDIVFDNNLYTENFIYLDNNIAVTLPVSKGFVHQYRDRTQYSKQTGWQTAAVASKIYQQFEFVYQANTDLILDVPAVDIDTVPSVKVYVDNQFQDPGTYSYSVGATTTTVMLSDALVTSGQKVVVLVLSNTASELGFYQVAANLENNPFNVNNPTFTLGSIRTHYQTIAENLLNFTGQVNGANNLRDLGNVVPFGLNILQQSSPLTLAGYFSRASEYNIWRSIQFNSQEYEKFKAQLLNIVVTNDYTNLDIQQTLTQAIADITIGRTSSNPFYWSDMLPHGSTYNQTVYTITPISTNVFDTQQVYNFTSANYQGLLVYYNSDTLLTRGVDYEVSVAAPTITVNLPLAVGDTITIQEYSTTYGSFIPNTPTKMGLYPAFLPEIYLDRTYVTPTLMIRGHDGSVTKCFGDFRDQLLLQFELRIYNNLKLDGNPVPLTAADVIPGQFRQTDYSIGEVNTILSEDFLVWASWNKLDYVTQQYSTNQFTWNYQAASNKLSATNSALRIGGWRGLYNYFYDTIYPNTRPWEMLGFAIEPDWWQIEYGPAPYTGDNLVLWDDLAQGLVKDPNGPYILSQYARPQLTQVIPAGSEGELLSPLFSVVGNYDSNTFKASWVFGDDGPVENAWRTSSAYPFAVMRLLALTRPAEFFSLFADRDLYQFNTSVNQYLYNGRYRLDANGIEIYGDGTSKASYINWIVDYNRVSGIDSTRDLTVALSNLDVRLCYRMASFSAKNYIQVYSERSSPDSTNSSLLLPDESYQLLFYKNTPFASITYSSVMIQKQANGYSVWGYGTVDPYFTILVSEINGATRQISSGGVTVSVPRDYTNKVVQVPYGYVFTNATVVADFLLSYGAYLEAQGMVFDSRENGYTLNWTQMVNEFLYFTTQGWADGTVINLNPAATKLSITRPGAIVDDVSIQTLEQQILNQDGKTLNARNLIVDRYDNSFVIESVTGETINLLTVKFVSFEHMMIFDNVSVFNDLIYEPGTGARQTRLSLLASTTTGWNGQLNASGFLLNQDNIQTWKPFKKYTKGDIVQWKNTYYSANDIVQPSADFKISQWSQSDYTKIQQGLLPNLATKSDQLGKTYSIYSANLERDQDLLAYGLIGFRPRQYMASLNLDDVSQVQLYSQFLPIKGSIQAAEIFKFADLGRGSAEYDIYENWALLRATYGANANRSFYELRLNEALLEANPSIIEVINNGQVSDADQTVTVDNIWKSSYKIVSPDILATTLESEYALPTAGYVNENDVDISVFDIVNPQALNANIDNITIGTNVWVAKVNNFDWGIFRTDRVPGRITAVRSNLNGFSTVVFSEAHGLVKDAILIIKFFDGAVNGTYRVQSVPDVFSVLISYVFLNSQQLVITGEGIGFTLNTQRVSQASDVATLSYVKNIQPGAKVWVDNDGTGHWTVLEKQDIFTAGGLLLPTSQNVNDKFGQSVSQSLNNLFATVGTPGYNSGTGIVTNFVKTSAGTLAVSGSIECNAAGTVGFGQVVDTGNLLFTAVGAPESASNLGYVGIISRLPTSADFFLTQLITPPDNDLGLACQFGASLVVSDDEQWLYVGAPGVNKVYAYALVQHETQTVNYTTNGTQSVFNYSNYIQINNAYADQLLVVLNGTALVPNVDYVLTASDVVFTTAPVSDLPLLLSRRTSVDYTGDGSTQTFSLIDYLGLATDINSFLVVVNGIVQRPNLDYELLSSSDEINFFTAPSNGNLIQISTPSYYKFVDEIKYFIEFEGSISGTTLTVSNIVPNGPQLIVGMKLAGSGINPETTITALGTGAGGQGTYTVDISQSVSSTTIYARLPESAKFGTSVSCTTDGQQIMIGAPNDRVAALDDTGSLYIFDRTVQQFLVTAANTTSFTVTGPVLVSPTQVSVNDSALVSDLTSPQGQYSVSGTTVNLDQAPNIGDLIQVNVNTFNFVQKFNAATPVQGSDYGQSVDVCTSNCSLFVGAPLTPLLVDEFSVVQESGSVFRAVNQSRIYGTTTSVNPNPVLVAGDTLRINNFEIAVPVAPNNTVSGIAAAINAANIPNVTASVGATGTVNAGRITVSVINFDAADPMNRLSVAPGQIGSAFERLGFVTFVQTQQILPPVAFDFGHFGQTVFRDLGSDTVIIGAPGASLVRATTFDNGTTFFDGKTTGFIQIVEQSGAVYTYDYLDSATFAVNSPGQFVFGQQLNNNFIQSLDQFGTGISYRNGVLLVGSPGHDTEDSTQSFKNYGSVNIFNNPTQAPAWSPIYTQTPVVDIGLINGVYSYDRITSAKTQFFDFFDPLQGKILGAAQQNLDYIGAIDPAGYNVGPVNNYGRPWTLAHLGQMWWDTNSARFIDPNQDDIVYAARRWGQLFPGSTVDVYQWTVSSVPPNQYTGPGVPRSLVSYTVKAEVNAQGLIITNYYFWVRGITSTFNQGGKTLAPTTVARYIENPRSSGVPYVAFLNASTTAIYNAVTDISAQDTILSIEFDRERTDNAVHTQFDLIPQDRSDGFLSNILYRKLQDSFSGTNTEGALVPDPFLPAASQYGVQFRPRQSMFVNRFSALENYLTQVNLVLRQYPIVESRNLSLLNSQDPEPSSTSGQWNKRVANLEELSYQNFAAVPVDYRYLVQSDSTQNGLWTIYAVTVVKTFDTLQLVKVQTYDTSRYWMYIDWYLPGYDSSVNPVTEVATSSLLDTLSVPIGSSVKVTNNAQGRFEIYQLTDTGWVRVGLQNGTIEFLSLLWDYVSAGFGFDADVFDNQYFDQYPNIETREIIQAINQQLLIDDLAIERNRALILMFNFVLTEQLAPEWLTKTSLVDVDHRIRELIPFQVYRPDNQEFVVDYIQEVKPYHVQVREINLIYDGLDQYLGTLTDFDIPAYFDTTIEPNQFVSPVLTPYTYSSAVGTGTATTNSDLAPTDPAWQTFPYNQWFANYLLEIQSIALLSGGAGYATNPQVIVSGTCEVPAQIEAQINSAGVVTRFVIVDPGQGYSETAVLTITGGGLPQNAEVWEPHTAYESGSFLVTADRNYYSVTTTGVSSGAQPDHLEGSETNGTLVLLYLGTNAQAIAVMGNSLVRTIKTTIKYDRFQYQSNVSEWAPGVNYDNGALVRYQARVWQASSDDSTGVQSETFDPNQWTLINAGQLTGIDRTQGYYTPTVNQPGLDLALLIDGIDYPGVQVAAPGFDQNSGFDVGNYDINPYDNIAFGPEGQPTFDPGILDVVYQSFFGTAGTGPIPTGTADTDINVSGGSFVDTYSSHAPEELVPGAEFDTMDLRVYTRPGSDWENDGHGFTWTTLNFTFVAGVVDSSNFAGTMANPVQVRVTNLTQGRDLILDLDYEIDWNATTVTILSRPSSPPAADGDVIVISVFGIGGGSQLFKLGYNGQDIGSAVTVPVAYNEIFELVIFVNGQLIDTYTYQSNGAGGTEIEFDSVYTNSDYVNITVMGVTAESYSWSTPITQYFTATGSLVFDLDNFTGGTNPANMIVEINGVRARPPQGACYTADGSTAYQLPTRGGYSQSLIADNEVHVWINNEPQTLYVDFTVEPYTSETDVREVIFSTAPAVGDQIDISVTTEADYRLSNDGSSQYNTVLTFSTSGGFYPIAGDTVAVTTWNDTSQQDLCTLLWQGPTTTGITANEPYDSVPFDSAALSFDPGSYDYTVGAVATVNDFQLGRTVTDPSRLWVTINGNRLFYGDDYLVIGEELVIHGPPVAVTDVVVATLFTNSVVPEALAFRIFQDMREAQATYRITQSTTTTLTQALSSTDDIVYVDNASSLTIPNLAANIWGVLTVNGERIMYREIDFVNNTVSDLMRGTYGTAADSHAVDSLVYNLGRDNLVPAAYQDTVVYTNTLANGTQTTFTAANIDLSALSLSFAQQAILVYVGGTRQVGNYSVDSVAPATVTFDSPPAAGSEVSIRVRQGLSWYEPGAGTASNGLALQIQTTEAAVFFRGN